MSNFKEMKDAEIWVQVVVREEIDEFGRKRRFLKWQKLDAPLNLGSVKKPKNQQVVGFKVVDKNPFADIDIKRFFGGFFGE